MRLLHTSDWHLGQDFHGFSREYEHQAFLTWLENQLEEQGVDALVVSGDIFDNQNPPIAAMRMLFQFIGRAVRRVPNLDIVLIGGNHDSAGRLEAPSPLLDELGVRVVGSLPRDANGGIDPDRLLLPLTDRHGERVALCAAVPFLRLPDLPSLDDEGQEPALIRGVREVYRRVHELCADRLERGEGLVMTGHCYMTGSEISELSERRILGGNQHALPHDLIPTAASYGALGHLHKPQRVGGRETLRYSGSPLPLSLTERHYPHQVVLVDLEGSAAQVQPLPVPRAVDVIRIPNAGAASPEEVLRDLRALDLSHDPGRDRQPYLEVVVALDRPAPSLRRDVEEALAGKPVRLARLAVQSAARPGSEPQSIRPDLGELQPEDVFLRCWDRQFSADPPKDILGAFRHLLETVESEEAVS